MGVTYFGDQKVKHSGTHVYDIEPPRGAFRWLKFISY